VRRGQGEDDDGRAGRRRNRRRWATQETRKQVKPASEEMKEQNRVDCIRLAVHVEQPTDFILGHGRPGALPAGQGAAGAIATAGFPANRISTASSPVFFVVRGGGRGALSDRGEPAAVGVEVSGVVGRDRCGTLRGCRPGLHAAARAAARIDDGGSRQEIGRRAAKPQRVFRACPWAG